MTNLVICVHACHLANDLMTNYPRKCEMNCSPSSPKSIHKFSTHLDEREFCLLMFLLLIDCV